MSLFLDDGDVRVLHGDCIEVMRGLPAASVAAVITDPPYGLGFMGRAWDDLPPGVEWAAECLRVLKPGGHLAAFGGTRTSHRLACAIEDAGFEIRDTLAWLYGSGFPKSRNLDGEWGGWGTALKPAHEPITLARKPLTGTVAQNALEHGTGALNVDACRVNPGMPYYAEDAPSRSKTYERRAKPTIGRYGEMPFSESSSNAGRWPANVILDAEAAAMLDTQTGESAGASRFFYTAKASSSERNDGLADRNGHPTVKPVDLMRWLIRLLTPPGALILDPFAGSGTTGVAARLESTRCILIEREAEYLPIIAGRLSQGSLFGGVP